MTPEIILHETTGQPAACLRGLVQYAWLVAWSLQAGRFADAKAFREWVYKQPVKLDKGEGPTSAGCQPAQRSRMWPTDGFNCWEATAHYLGVAIRRKQEGELHIYDTMVNGQRHVFPAYRPRGSSADPQPLVLQPPLVQTAGSLKRMRKAAQAIAVQWPLTLLKKHFAGALDKAEANLDREGRNVRREQWRRSYLPGSVLAVLPAEWRNIEGYLAALKTGGWWFAVPFGNFFTDRGYHLFEVADPGSMQPERGGGSGTAPGAPPAQAWYNDLFGGVHAVGDKVLRFYGAGGVSDAISSAAGGELPDWARTPEQRAAQLPPVRTPPTPPPPPEPPAPPLPPPEPALARPLPSPTRQNTLARGIRDTVILYDLPAAPCQCAAQTLQAEPGYPAVLCAHQRR